MDKAPDAFRTISEVADELDIPQHVLRFWETRFTQIKPMKRSGGRRYYRPDDVDLLKGIRRLLYGEGYTIRGVQRILKEHGIKSVQRLADASTTATFGAVEEAIGRSVSEPVHELAPGIDADDDDYESEPAALDLHAAMHEPRFGADVEADAAEDDSDVIPGVEASAHPFDVIWLRGVLEDLVACRQLIDAAMKDS
ncbi:MULTISPECIES: MerR family transcriptional regulator [Rhodopseudomonas]|uniref:MerR family transcriptional regulator n=1 Tax=Rhodopseudomonas palustris TaxID=1076 RepID=A0A0D7EE76_RHOPL|nr:MULTISPECIES: MerR family transcriptional regulator [Rhodopseudomonas]KIZ37857.1 MerR family transcriptional regulator [Rhodopseudomonas palustris]MDF3808795.1 MerR family transcriptional regulator [Rhodopseudomonas sp. BAL398]WOK19169.1 MerR family transcriptional regulator [Rhodopseudomonas sp. BAL398]